MMKLLLHTCCAPCAIYPIDEAKKDGFDITGFFCNSNIHPQAEYVKRKEAACDFFKSEGLELIFPTYEPDDFFANVRADLTAGRCAVCWSIRLRETVFFAKYNGLDAFTTTLLGSPYQDHGELKRICEDLSREEKIHFYYKNFRIGFREAHENARKRGMYCQNYCGCVFSFVEREEARTWGVSPSGRIHTGRRGPRGETPQVLAKDPTSGCNT